MESAGTLFKSGRLYLWATAQYDPLGASVIILGIIAGVLVVRTRGSILASLSIFLYLLYVVWIGGDFMLGRFFAAPMAVAFVILGIAFTELDARGARVLRGRWLAVSAAAAGVLSVLFLIVSPHAPLRISPAYENRWMTERGYADEKGHYFPESGLHVYFRGQVDFPDSLWTRQGRKLKNSGERTVVGRNMGFLGFHAGPGVHILDEHALTDPFLARLRGFKERPGHIARFVPAEYVSTAVTGHSSFANQQMSQLSADIRTATCDPLTAPGRAAAVVRLLTRHYGPLAVTYRLRAEDLHKFRTESWWPAAARTMNDEELSEFVLSGRIFQSR